MPATRQMPFDLRSRAGLEPAVGLLAAVATALNAFQSWRRRARSRRLADQLSELNDHLLRDIGLNRVALRYDDPAVLLPR